MKIIVERDRRNGRWTAYAEGGTADAEAEALSGAGFSPDEHGTPATREEPMWDRLPLPYRVVNA